MKEYSTEQIRNVALIGHGSSGKTMLAEAILAQAKAIPKMGSVDHGNTIMDWDSVEIERKSSVNVSVASTQLKDIKLNLLDTPGFPDFIGDVAGALSVCETSIAVVCAVSGVQVQTLQTLNYAYRLENAKMIFINKMDRENADFDKVYDDLKAKLGADKVAAVVYPVGRQASFKGIVNLITNTAEIDGKKVEIPAEIKESVAALRSALLENVAGSNEALMNKYLDSGELTSEEVMAGLKTGIKEGGLIPVFCGSALKNIGVQQLAELLPSCAPSPVVATGNASALVFKTIIDPFIGKMSYFKVRSGVIASDTAYPNSRTEEAVKGKISYIFGKKHEDAHNVVAGDIASFVKIDDARAGDYFGAKGDFKIPYPKPCHAMAIEVAVKGTEDKLAIGLSKLVEDDPVMTMKRDPETHQTLILGIGDTQIELVKKKLERDYKVKVQEVEIIVPYRETIQRKGHGDYKHKKQTGGAGQFAHVVMDIEPLPRGKHYEFVNGVVGGAIPKNFIPAVEKGVIEAMQKGGLAGFPVVDVKSIVVDGKDHPVDSNDMAFKIAGRGAFHLAQNMAGAILLEPIYEIRIMLPDDYTGDVMGDMNQRRGRVEGIEAVGSGMTLIKAHVPYAEILKYSIDLKALTHGRGSFEMAFSNYEVVPSMLQQKIIDKHGKKPVAEE